jgi:hypothetical protein
MPASFIRYLCMRDPSTRLSVQNHQYVLYNCGHTHLMHIVAHDAPPACLPGLLPLCCCFPSPPQQLLPLLLLSPRPTHEGPGVGACSKTDTWSLLCYMMSLNIMLWAERLGVSSTSAGSAIWLSCSMHKCPC